MRLAKEELEARTHTGECSECGGYFPVCNICGKCMRGFYGNGSGSCHKPCKIDAEVVRRLALKDGWAEDKQGNLRKSINGYLFRLNLKKRVVRHEEAVTDGVWLSIDSYSYAAMKVNKVGKLIIASAEKIL